LLTLEKQPSRIVSTSVTLSGTITRQSMHHLLLLARPCCETPASRQNKAWSLRQWQTLAGLRNEALSRLSNRAQRCKPVIKRIQTWIIYLMQRRGDSALKLYDQLKDIAPILFMVIGYDGQKWYSMADILREHSCPLKNKP